MRLANLSMINRSVGERERLLKLRAEVEADQCQVVIRGTYQDDAMAALVRPVIVGELNGRIRALERELVGMGVELS